MSSLRIFQPDPRQAARRKTATSQMAPGTPGVSVGLFICAHSLETDSLKLNAQHFPLSCSLRELVLRRYVDAMSADGNEQAMPLETVLGYLTSTDNFEQAPLEAVMAQAKAQGDPALPTAEQ
jgi:predicted component of type VI protein secretion system